MFFRYLIVLLLCITYYSNGMSVEKIQKILTHHHFEDADESPSSTGIESIISSTGIETGVSGVLEEGVSGVLETDVSGVLEEGDGWKNHKCVADKCYLYKDDLLVDIHHEFSMGDEVSIKEEGCKKDIVGYWLCEAKKDSLEGKIILNPIWWDGLILENDEPEYDADEDTDFIPDVREEHCNQLRGKCIKTKKEPCGGSLIGGFCKADTPVCCIADLPTTVKKLELLSVTDLLNLFDKASVKMELLRLSRKMKEKLKDSSDRHRFKVFYSMHVILHKKEETRSFSDHLTDAMVLEAKTWLENKKKELGSKVVEPSDSSFDDLFGKTDGQICGSSTILKTSEKFAGYMNNAWKNALEESQRLGEVRWTLWDFGVKKVGAHCTSDLRKFTCAKVLEAVDAGSRRKQGNHAVGCAADYDATRNKYLLYESGERAYSAEVSNTFERISELMLGRGSVVPYAVLEKRNPREYVKRTGSEVNKYGIEGNISLFDRESAGETWDNNYRKTPEYTALMWDALFEEQEAQIDYFELTFDGNSDKLAAALERVKEKFSVLYPDVETVDQLKKEIGKDWFVLTGRLNTFYGVSESDLKSYLKSKGFPVTLKKSNSWKMHKNPTYAHSSSITPLQGYMAMDKIVAVEHEKEGFRWLGIRSRTAATDLMHFDYKCTQDGTRDRHGVSISDWFSNWKRKLPRGADARCKTMTLADFKKGFR